MGDKFGFSACCLVSTQILGQLRVTSTQFQEKYPYIASTGEKSLTLKLNNLGSVLKFWDR